MATLFPAKSRMFIVHHEQFMWNKLQNPLFLNVWLFSDKICNTLGNVAALTYICLFQMRKNKPNLVKMKVVLLLTLSPFELWMVRNGRKKIEPCSSSYTNSSPLRYRKTYIQVRFCRTGKLSILCLLVESYCGQTERYWQLWLICAVLLWPCHAEKSNMFAPF